MGLSGCRISGGAWQDAFMKPVLRAPASVLTSLLRWARGRPYRKCFPGVTARPGRPQGSTWRPRLAPCPSSLPQDPRGPGTTTLGIGELCPGQAAAPGLPPGEGAAPGPPPV